MTYIYYIIIGIIFDVLLTIYKIKKAKADELNWLSGTNDFKWWKQPLWTSRKEREEVEAFWAEIEAEWEKEEQEKKEKGE